MIFYNDTNKNGICQEADRLCDSDDTSYPRIAKTSRANQAMNFIIGKLINADGTWQFDDSNYTDLPVGTGTLTATIALYTFSEEFLDIENIKIRDVNGKWSILKPIDQMQTDIPLEELSKVDGLPYAYDKVTDDTIRLIPAPKADSVYDGANIKIQFKRKQSDFDFATDTSEDTKEPGFAINHEVIAFMIAIPQCMVYHQNRVALYEKRRDEMIKEIVSHYGQREKDKRKKFTMKQISFR